VRETLRLDEAQAPPPARPDTVPAPPPLRLGTRRIEPIVPPVVSAASEETTEAAQPPPPPAPRPRNTPPEPATATPRSLFGLADVTPSAPPPRMLPHPVPPPGTAATPGLLPAKSRPEPPRPQPAHAEKSRTFYVPTAQLLQLPLSAEAIDSGFALQRASGDQVGALIPLRRTAYMLGRRDESGDPPHRISLEDVYLPREHAVLLWDPHAGGYRLHLMENSLVTTRVTRQEGSQSRDYLITSRQPFSLEADDEIALGDSRLFLRSTGSA